MILINLLPPELRRSRREGVNPVVLAAAASILLVLAVAGTWLWVERSRIRAAESLLAQRTAELGEAKKKADQVRAVEKQITDFQRLHTTITGLITRKMFWARTLDDFAHLLAQTGENRWTREGYEVRCTSLTVAPAAATAQRGGARGGTRAAGPAAITYSFRANFRIVGEQSDYAGDYLRSFFQTVDDSVFWSQHGFVDRSEQNYRGDAPKVVKEIDRIITDLPLEWRRSKVLPAVATATAAAASQGARK